MTATHMTAAHDGATQAVAWIFAALCLIAVIEGVTVALLVAAKRRSRRATSAVPAEAPDREEVAA